MCLVYILKIYIYLFVRNNIISVKIYLFWDKCKHDTWKECVYLSQKYECSSFFAYGEEYTFYRKSKKVQEAYFFASIKEVYDK